MTDLSHRFDTSGAVITHPIFASGTAIDGRKHSPNQIAKIYTNTKRAMAEANLTPPVTIGHRQSVLDKQEMVGYIQDISLQDAVFAGKRCKVIDAKMFLYDETLGKYNKGELPNFSVEIPPAFFMPNGRKLTSTIWSVALLGAEVPALPWLSKIQYGEGDTSHLFFAHFGAQIYAGDKTMPDETKSDETKPEDKKPEQMQVDLDGIYELIDSASASLSDAAGSEDPTEIYDFLASAMEAITEAMDMTEYKAKEYAAAPGILGRVFGSKPKPAARATTRLQGLQDKRLVHQANKIRELEKFQSEMTGQRETELFTALFAQGKVKTDDKADFSKFYAATGHDGAMRFYSARPTLATPPGNLPLSQTSANSPDGMSPALIAHYKAQGYGDEAIKAMATIRSDKIARSQGV